ncbi:MAG: hypothetical protein QXG03_08205 [Halalkalicoccus sp.]
MDGSQRTYAPLLLIALGTILLFNPLYAFPGDATPENRYEVESIGDDERAIGTALQFAHNVHFCPGTRTCLAEERVASEGSVTVDSGVFDHQRGYDVVVIDGGYYAPAGERTDDGTYRLTHEELSGEEALAAASIPSEHAGADVRRAIRWGSVGSDDPIPVLEERAIVAHGGEYYQTTTVSRGQRSVPDRAVIGVRLAGFALGGGALVAGYRRQRRLIADTAS